MNYFWQLQRGQTEYRLQTDERAIYEKLKRRNGFNLVGCSISGQNLWIYSCNFSRPDISTKTFQNITGQKPEIDSEGVFCCG
ncbi:MAG: hypothetical protein V1720_14830 [bacterium]